MALKDLKITSFQKPIAALGDRPNSVDGLSSEQLKEYFDSSPEELRLALNNVIDQVQIQTFGSKVKQGKIIYYGEHSGNQQIYMNGVSGSNYKYTTGSLLSLNGDLFIMDVDGNRKGGSIYANNINVGLTSGILNSWSLDVNGNAIIPTVSFVGNDLVISVNTTKTAKCIAILNYVEIMA